MNALDAVNECMFIIDDATSENQAEASVLERLESFIEDMMIELEDAE